MQLKYICIEWYLKTAKIARFARFSHFAMDVACPVGMLGRVHAYRDDYLHYCNGFVLYTDHSNFIFSVILYFQRFVTDLTIICNHCINTNLSQMDYVRKMYVHFIFIFILVGDYRDS